MVFEPLPRPRRLINTLTKQVVGLGGAAVIVAIALIFFYLVWVVVPLFQGGNVESSREPHTMPVAPLLIDTDDSSEVGLAIARDGLARFFDLATGREIEAVDLGLGPVLEATGVEPGNNRYALRAGSGELVLIDASYEVQFVDGVRQVIPGISYPFEKDGVPMPDALSFDVFQSDFTVLVAVLKAPDELTLLRFDEAEPGFPLEFPRRTKVRLDGRYDHVLIGPRARWIYTLNQQGDVQLLDMALPIRPQTAFKGQLIEESGEVTALAPLLGRHSLLVGDASGTVTQWTLTRTGSGHQMKPLRRFEVGAEARQIIPERRRKGFAVVDAANNLHLVHTTSQRRLNSVALGDISVDLAAFSPRADRLLLADDDVIHLMIVHNEHPEVSFGTLWRKVWYESYPEPVLSWQSSSADNDFEPKFSLTPLAFGTLKAAVYAMLFAMPIAIAGAVYTAYFMAPSMRRWVKPGIEIMAALPTVILGFLAGLWLAPLVEEQLTGILMLTIVIPAGIVVFAWVHGLLPRRARHALDGWYGAVTVPLIVVLGWATLASGPALEHLLFDGDTKAWLRTTWGLDYDQRNALIVGIAMGLAVIPTIFSIAEDAVYGVPQHLINGSLALGATRWQTLVRVVILTASPGIFSAVMIGLGRAVGETMIVLMATGNTAVMDLNIFQGMRTFAANIAVELPESEVASTHYRILFLTALVLFMVTFVFNSVAEIVRQRLRAKYGSL